MHFDTFYKSVKNAKMRLAAMCCLAGLRDPDGLWDPVGAQSRPSAG